MQSLSRHELYEQVWLRPLGKVAADYGITGTALKKICDRHEIPTPEPGYWIKLQYGKQVKRSPLAKASEEHLDEVRIVGAGYQRPSVVKEAKAKARERLEEVAESEPAVSAPTKTADEIVADTPVLAATLRAIRKAQVDTEGFGSANGRGIVPLKIGPTSIDRALRLLSQFLSLAETQSYRAKSREDGLVLIVEDEPIPFALEEQPEKSLHQPTPAELERQEDRKQWGHSGVVWNKYDNSPSGRLAIVIRANEYSGLRRTYSDRKAKPLEEAMSSILEAFAEHAAYAKERRRQDEERDRQRGEAEARRRREEAFGTREKRRMEFVEAVHEQLVRRSKLTAVLAHLEETEKGRPPQGAMAAWIRRRIRQLDALISPEFLDLSARSAKLAFTEAEATAEGDSYYTYYPPLELRYWSMDEERGQATSQSALQWLLNSEPLDEPDDGEGST